MKEDPVPQNKQQEELQQTLMENIRHIYRSYAQDPTHPDFAATTGLSPRTVENIFGEKCRISLNHTTPIESAFRLRSYSLHYCQSAWGPDADRRAKLLIHQAGEGSILEACSQSPSRSVPRPILPPIRPAGRMANMPTNGRQRFRHMFIPSSTTGRFPRSTTRIPLRWPSATR
jgi:hypothetical protein